MIAATYALAGVLLAVTGQLFQMGVLDGHDADRDVDASSSSSPRRRRVRPISRSANVSRSRCAR